MSTHGTQNQPVNPTTPGPSSRTGSAAVAGGPARHRGTGFHASSATITLIGDDGTEYGTPVLPATHPDPQPGLPPVRLTCPAGCGCWRAIEGGEAPIRIIEPDELLAWLAALAGPLRSPLAHKRMYHHVRTTQPESPLNAGFVGVARGLAAFGVRPAHYRALHDAVGALGGERVIALLGGLEPAAAAGLTFTAKNRLTLLPALTWDHFCPLVWGEGSTAAHAVLTAGATGAAETAEAAGQ